jgi:non-ribosomal peptide synthetase-like protein
VPIGTNSDRSPLDIVICAFQQSFPYARPMETDDFFLDLGGHSIIAAITITRLRESFPDIAIQDLYECKTAANLAQHLTLKYNNNNVRTNLNPTIKGIKPTCTRSLICSVVQACVLVVLTGIYSLEFLLPYIFFDRALMYNIGYAYLVAYATFVAIPPFRYILVIIIKWIVIGRYKEGDFPLWGTMYVRWWIVEQFRHLATLENMSDTPLMAIFYRLLGVKIGRNVHLGSLNCSAVDLLEIGDATTISSDVCLQTAFVDDYMLKFRRICIKNDVYIGAHSVVSGQTKMEDHSRLSDMSFLPPDTCVPSSEVWRGSPATYWCQTAPLHPGSETSNNKLTSIFFTVIFTLLTLLFIPLVYFLPMMPGLTLFEYFHRPSLSSWAQVVIFSPIIGILYTCLVVLEIIFMHYALIFNMKEGVYSTNSLTYIRQWLFSRLSDIALHVIHTLYATLYFAPFLRALGAKIGHRCEFSTAIGMIHSLVEVDDECFIADGVTLGKPLINRGQIHLKKTILGKRVFIGNSAVIPNGARIPDNCLIGCLSLAPDGLKEGQSCLGSPAIILPTRSVAAGNILEEFTYRPPTNLIVKRFCIDTIRVFFPRIIIIFEIGIAVEIFKIYDSSMGFGLALLTLPFLYIFIFAIPSLFICITLKWLLMRTYKTNQHAMWTWFVWTSELVTVTYEQLAIPLLLDFLRGTFFLAPALRCFGVKIGRGCFLYTADMTEFDLIHIGNYVVLNNRVGLQTHLFEDRIMKVAEVYVEDEATLGSVSIMLPNTRLGRAAKLGPLSLMMKGEGVLAETSWQGIPIRAYNPSNNRTHGFY